MSWTKLTLLAFAAVAGGSLAIGVGAATLNHRQRDANTTSNVSIVGDPGSIAADPAADPAASDSPVAEAPSPTPPNEAKKTAEPAVAPASFELEIKLKQALSTYFQTQRLHQSHNVSSAELVLASYAVDAIRAQIKGRRDALADENERNKAESDVFLARGTVARARREKIELVLKELKDQVNVTTTDPTNALQVAKINNAIRIAELRGDLLIEDAQIRLLETEHRAMMVKSKSVSRDLESFDKLLQDSGLPGAPIPPQPKAEDKKPEAAAKP